MLKIICCKTYMYLQILFYKFYVNNMCVDSERLYQALLEANLATEVGLTVLDCLGLYCLHFREALSSEPSLMPSVFNLYLSFLQVGQSETLFRHVFAALRAFINNFSTPLFKGNYLLIDYLL